MKLNIAAPSGDRALYTFKPPKIKEICVNFNLETICTKVRDHQTCDWLFELNLLLSLAVSALCMQQDLSLLHNGKMCTLTH